MSAAESFFQIKPDGLLISIQVQPGARKSEIREVSPEGFLKIKLNAPAIEGKANAALVAFLSETLGVRKSAIQIVSGEFARKKRVLFKAERTDELIEELKRLI